MDPKSGRIALLVVAIVAVGIFAMPNTVSLFSGQHTWYDLQADGSQVPCEKCHGDIVDEMASTGAHEDFPCEYCHRTDDEVGSYAGDYWGVAYDTPGTGAHAASTEDCMICHDGEYGNTNFTHAHILAYPNIVHCVRCHPGMYYGGEFYPPTAGGLNLSHAPDDSGTKAAHKAFVLGSKDENSTLMIGTNEACIACHTRIGVNITWMKKEYLDFHVSEDAVGSWSIPSFTAGGTNVTQVNSTNTWTNK